MKNYLKYSVLILLLFTLTATVSARDKRGKYDYRLLYWNIQNGMWAGQNDNYSQFVDWVSQQKPDICVWCEAQSIYISDSTKKLPTDERYLVDGWAELAARYGHNYVYIGGHRDNYPQAITSRYPIENIARITGEESDVIVSHGAGWATITLNGQKINIVTLHTWPQKFAFGATDREESKRMNEGDKYRRREIEYICRNTILKSESPEKELWLMMGDFNSISSLDNAKYHNERSSTMFLVNDYVLDYTPYVDVIKAKYPDKFIPSTGSKSKRIDYIYASPLMYEKIHSAEIVWDEYTTPRRALDSNGKQLSNFWLPSDHLPIIIDFSVR